MIAINKVIVKAMKGQIKTTFISMQLSAGESVHIDSCALGKMVTKDSLLVMKLGSNYGYTFWAFGSLNPIRKVF